MNINALNAQASLPLTIHPFRPQTMAQTGKSDKVLQGIAQKVLDTYESENRAARIKGQAIELADYATAGLDEETLEETPKEVLKLYLHEFGFMKNVAVNGVHLMNEVKDGLNACDQAAAEYQDMLDGKTELPEDMTREDVEKLADITQKQREKYIRAANDVLDSSLGGVFGVFSGELQKTFGENPFEGEDMDTQLDASNSTEEILAQIDGVISRLSGAADVLDEGISLIARELERQDALDEKIRKYIQMLSGSIDPFCGFGRRSLADVMDRLDCQDRYDEAMRTGNYVDHGNYIEYSTYG